MQAQKMKAQGALERVGSKRIHPKILRAICVLWLVGMLAPLLGMCFYAHPAYDDFPHVFAASEAWAQTGDLFEALKAAWSHTLDMYQTWQGTWVAMLISSFQPMVFSSSLFWLTPFILLAVLCLSAAYFVKALTVKLLGASRDTCLALYTALMTYLTQFMPSVREVVYWQSGTPYTWSLIFILLMLGLLLKLNAPQGKALTAWRWMALLACSLCLGGCPYPLALGSAVGMALVALWCIIKRSKARVGSVIAFVGVLASLIVVVLAPGNGARQARVGETASAPLAVLTSLMECAAQTGQWISPQLLAFVLIVALLLWKPLQQNGYDFPHPLFFSVLSFGVLAACFVPPIFATGEKSYLVGRVLSSLYMMFVLLVLLNTVYWVGHLGKKHVTASPPSPAPAWVAALCLVLFVWGLFSVSITQTPSLSTAKDILLGNAATYDAEMTAREEQLANAETQEQLKASVHELSVAPPMLPVDMLFYQTNTSLPSTMHRYYRMQALLRQYGAGNIPQVEWDGAAIQEP